MSIRAYGVLAAVILLTCGAFLALHFSNGNGGGSNDPGTEDSPILEYDPGDIPDSVAVRTDPVSLCTEACSVWTVYDLFHTYYNMDSYGSFTTVYEGEVVTSDILFLDPGWYRITVDGKTFEILVNGHISRVLSWTYDFDGSKVDASVSFEVDAKELRNEYIFADGFNSCVDGGDRHKGYASNHGFSDLPRLVRAGSTVSDVQSKLSREFLRLGGDMSDRQSYADFIAGFVQLAIRYPPSVSGYPGEYDLGQYGWAEYWAVPIQTLYHGMGDCEDMSALFCALADDAGFDVAMAGKAGHVFAGIVLDDFEEVPEERLKALGGVAGSYGHVYHTAVDSGDAGSSPDAATVYHAVELIKKQVPVGYAGNTDFGANTHWGVTGFYPLRSR